MPGVPVLAAAVTGRTQRRVTGARPAQDALIRTQVPPVHRKWTRPQPSADKGIRRGHAATGIHNGGLE
jgi:hypothetical protein